MLSEVVCGDDDMLVTYEISLPHPVRKGSDPPPPLYGATTSEDRCDIIFKGTRSDQALDRDTYFNEEVEIPNTDDVSGWKWSQRRQTLAHSTASVGPNCGRSRDQDS